MFKLTYKDRCVESSYWLVLGYFMDVCRHFLCQHFLSFELKHTVVFKRQHTEKKKGIVKQLLFNELFAVNVWDSGDR